MKQWQNDFTRECDKYAFPKMYSTHLYGNDDGVVVDGKGWVRFSFLGTTRGGILLEDGRIKRIHFDVECFDENIGCYERDVIDAAEGFIGRPFYLPLVKEV